MASADKLFVGQIPKVMLEDELRPIFMPFGNVLDLHVLRDHTTKAHKGCCFVTYSTKEEAEAAIFGLHNKITLPGMTSAIQVKWAGDNPRNAGGLQGGGGGTAPATTHKLFIGMVPKTYREEDLRPIFAPFGEIKDMNVLRGPDGVSKGCAFILFKDVASAVQAITTLNAKIKLEGASSNLVVQFASSADKNRAQNQSIQLQGLGGLGQQFLGAPGGFVLPNQTFGLDPYGGLTAAPGLSAYQSYLPLTNAASATYGYASTVSPAVASGTPMGSNKEGPAGANLFIYHLPKDYTDGSLYSMYSQFGTVLSCKVITDKDTGESKGFGFVSYESPDSAQIAILNTNGMQLPGGKRLKVEVKALRAATGGAPRPY